MITKINNIAAALLGLIFVVFGLNFFFHFIPIPALPEDSAAAQFMGTLFQTGYLKFIKILEVVGGVMVAIPFLRSAGLLILGPIIVNILAFHYFMFGLNSMLDPVVIVIAVLGLYLLIVERKRFCPLCSR